MHPVIMVCRSGRAAAPPPDQQPGDQQGENVSERASEPRDTAAPRTRLMSAGEEDK
jgi:hypothetical protein